MGVKMPKDDDPDFVIHRLAIEIGAWRTAHADRWGATDMARYLVEGVLVEPAVVSELIARADIDA